jgi:hypothetical protein
MVRLEYTSILMIGDSGGKRLMIFRHSEPEIGRVTFGM